MPWNRGSAAKKTAQLKRCAIKAVEGLGKKVLYSAASRALKDEILKINKQYLAERLAIHEKYRRLA